MARRPTSSASQARAGAEAEMEAVSATSLPPPRLCVPVTEINLATACPL